MSTFLRYSIALLILASAAWTQAEVVDSTLELDGVTSVQLVGPYELNITQGDQEFVTVTTEKSNLENIEASVSGDELRLGNKKRQSWGWFDSNNIPAKFTVQVRSLNAVSNRGSGEIEIGRFKGDEELRVTIHGSGDTRIESFEGEELVLESRGSGRTRVGAVAVKELQVQSHGSGDVEIGSIGAESVELGLRGSSDMSIGKGNTETLEISIHGSGDIDASDLKAREVEVAIFGSGDVKVYASEELDVSIHGSGDVRYGGNPETISRSVHGSGDIEAR